MGQAIQYRPSGGLNKDAHVQDVNQGDYLDAKDIQFMADSSNNTAMGQEPVRGNRLLFEIPSPTEREMRYRVEFSYPTNPTNTLRECTIGGVNFTYSQSSSDSPIANQSFFYPALIAQPQPSLPPGVVNNYVNNTTDVYTEFDIKYLSNYPTDLHFIDNAQNGRSSGLYGLVRQAIPNNDYILNTPLKVVSEFNLNNEVFLISCVDPGEERRISDDADGYSVAITSIGTIGGQTVYDIDITFVNPTPILENDVIDIEFNYDDTDTYSVAKNVKVVSVLGNTIRVNWLGTQVPFLLSNRSRITINPVQYAELGVYANGSYKKLLELIDFNISSHWQPQLLVEKNSERYEIYWTDDVNPPRSVYYFIDDLENDFVSNGCVYGSRDRGTYIFDNILLATSLIQKDTIRANPTDVNLSGGKLIAGTKRYTVSPVGLGGVNSDYSVLSRPINIYSSNGSDYAENWRGDETGTATTKSVELMVYGIPKGVFQSVDLAVVEFANVAQTATVFAKKSLHVFEKYFIDTHTGYEPESTVLDVSTIPSINQTYRTAKSISALDNRLILSNVNYAKRYDLSDVCATFTYGLYKESIVANPTVPNETGIGGALLPGSWKEEYLNPLNNSNTLGYMHNETYRFGVRFKYKGLNQWTDVFWVADIKISTDLADNDSRCTQALEDYNLTYTDYVYAPYSQDMRVVKVPYVKINVDIPGDYVLEDGKLFSEVFEYQAEIMRSECVKEVLCTGASVCFRDDNKLAFNVNINENRDKQAFYSVELQAGTQTLLTTESYKYLTLGSPPQVDYRFTLSPPDYPYRFDDYDGNFGSVGVVNAYAETNIVGGGSFISYSTEAQYYNNDLSLVIEPTEDYLTPSPVTMYSLGCYIFHTDATVVATGTGNANTNRRIKYGQIFKEIPNKYGDKKYTTYISCNNIENSLRYNFPTNAWGLIDVFGGDTYTQKTFFKYCNNNAGDLTGGAAFCLYTQNRINAQMIRTNGNVYYSPYYYYPNQDTNKQDLTIWWVGKSTSDTPPNEGGIQKFLYENSYTPRNTIQTYVAYDPDVLDFDEAPTRIVYSNVKQNSSPLDAYRYFPPLNFHDLQLSEGEIIAHHSVNGELFTWQNRQFQRQYFNTRGTLTVSDGTQVLIGDAGVMSRDGDEISSYGCNQKWAVIKGKSSGGKDVVYWISTEHKKLVRFGSDGTVMISDLRGIKRDLFNRLTVSNAIAYDRPASGKGIHGVWNDRFNEVIYTFLGDSDPFSLVFSEAKNKFTNEFSPYPNIYIPYKSNYMTPSNMGGATNTSQIYVHDDHVDCSYATWYDGELTSEPYFEFVFNALPDTSKRWEAFMVNSQNAPFRVEFKTEGDTYPLSVPNLVSYLDEAEFERRENYFYAPIKNDSTVSGSNPSGLNDLDTSQMYGKWLRVKFIFEGGLYQNVRDFVVKILQRNRNFNK